MREAKEMDEVVTRERGVGTGERRDVIVVRERRRRRTWRGEGTGRWKRTRERRGRRTGDEKKWNEREGIGLGRGETKEW